MEPTIKKFKPYTKLIDLSVSLDSTRNGNDTPSVSEVRKGKDKGMKSNDSPSKETSSDSPKIWNSFTEDFINTTESMKQRNNCANKIKTSVTPTDNMEGKENNSKEGSVDQVEECMIVPNSNESNTKGKQKKIWNSSIEDFMNTTESMKQRKNCTNKTKTSVTPTDNMEGKENNSKEGSVDQVEECVIVPNSHETNTKVKPQRIWISPAKILNSNINVNTENSSGDKRSLEVSPITTTPKLKNKRLLDLTAEEIGSFDKRKLRRKKLRRHLTKMMDQAIICQPLVDISDKKCSSSGGAIVVLDLDSPCTPSTSEGIIPSLQNPTKDTHSSQSSCGSNDTITIDDSIVIEDSSTSDLTIVQDRKQIKKKLSEDVIIVDLVKISAPMTKAESPVEIVSLEPVKASTSHNQNSALNFPSCNSLPDIIPLEFGSKKKKLGKKKARKDKLGISKKSKKLDKSPGMKKLKKLRKGILNQLSIVSPSSSPTKVHPSGPSTSTALSNTTELLPIGQGGPAISVWTNFTNAGPNVPCFINPTPFNSQFNANCFNTNTSANAGGSRHATLTKPQLNNNNIYNPAASSAEKTGLRPIVIDGSNVAFEYMKTPLTGLKFNSKGIEIVVDYFKRRGHKTIYVFIPAFRAFHSTTLYPEILQRLQNEGILLHTPSRKVKGSMQVPYDDRYIVQVATELDAVIVSNDRYRDIMAENDQWRSTIENRLLMFNFVGEMLMFPQDPQGRGGPDLDTYLRF